MLLITIVSSIFLLTLSILAVAGRHFFLPKTKVKTLPRVPRAASLFAPDKKVLAEIAALEAAEIAAQKLQSLILRAENGDFEVLSETVDQNVKNKLLETLTRRAENEDDIRVLTTLVKAQNLKVNQSLIGKFADVWQNQPTRSNTVEFLHLAALSDDANIFHQTIETIQNSAEFSSTELRNLIESQFWLLSQSARNSGAGFLLKQKMSALRR